MQWLGYGLNNLGIVFRFPAVTWSFPRICSNQVLSSPAFYSKLLGALFSKVETLGREINRWRTFSVELKNGRNYTSSPSYALVECIKVTLLEIAACVIYIVTLSRPVAIHPYNYGYACQVTVTTATFLFQAVAMWLLFNRYCSLHLCL